MLTLTPSAVTAVDTILHTMPAPGEAGLRIAPVSEREIAVQVVAEPAPGDQIIEDEGARVFVDPQIAPMLDDVQLEAHDQEGQIAFGLAPADSTP